MKRIEKVILFTFLSIFFGTLFINQIYSRFFLKMDSLTLSNIKWAVACASTYVFFLWITTVWNKILCFIAMLAGIIFLFCIIIQLLATNGFSDVREAFINFRIIFCIINCIICWELSIRHGDELEKYNVKRLKMLIEEIKLDEEMSKENDELYD